MKKYNKALKNNHGFIKNIRKAVPKHCSNCGNKYKPEDLTLIQKDDFSAIFHLTCPKCKESYLINVVTPLGNLQGSSRMPLKIDITSAKEAKKYIEGEAVTSDDVLNIHELLEKLDKGDELKKLLDKQS